MSTRILLIDPDVAHTDWLTRSLAPIHWTVTVADTVSDAMQALWHQPDCVVTDLEPLSDHPGGLILVSQLLKHKSRYTPLMVCSGILDQQARVSALRIGADTVLSKPLDVDLFIANIEALISNARIQEDTAREVDEFAVPPSPWRSPPVVVGPLEIDRYAAYLDGEPSKLTPSELKLLLVLAKHHPRPVSHTDLIVALWGKDSGPEEEWMRALTSHKSRLDAKLRPRLRIVAVRGANSGYRLKQDSDSLQEYTRETVHHF